VRLNTAEAKFAQIKFIGKNVDRADRIGAWG
jgi:hypothetical protein